jgi:hypothetical protein
LSFPNPPLAMACILLEMAGCAGGASGRPSFSRSQFVFS